MDGTRMRRAIERKRDGEALDAGVWSTIVRAYTADELDEAQMAALAMAVSFRGLDFGEMSAVTRAMVDSGERVSFGASDRAIVDKHSSGGVGDTVSLIAIPVAAAAGVRVAKLSGRALGHTGGTLDKIEALGARTDLSADAFVRQVETIGCAIAAQSVRLVPADKKLYALRDRTGTIPSIGLIAASIVSKKVAGGAGAVVYDVKSGRGAFLQASAAARRLAHALVALSADFGLAAHALVTDMEEPLGSAVGSGLEGLAARDYLRNGGGAGRLGALSERVGDALIAAGGGVPGSYVRALADGSAYETFVRLLAAQGADARSLERLRAAEPLVAVRSPRAGFITAIDGVALGERARDLIERAGPFAGICAIRGIGERIETGDRLALVAGGDDAIARRVAEAFRVEEEAPQPRPLVYVEIGVAGSSEPRSTEATK